MLTSYIRVRGLGLDEDHYSSYYVTLYPVATPHYTEEPLVVHSKDKTESLHSDGLEKLMIDVERDASKSPEPVTSHTAFVKPVMKSNTREKEVTAMLVVVLMCWGVK